jgi:hypothetical protein
MLPEQIDELAERYTASILDDLEADTGSDRTAMELAWRKIRRRVDGELLTQRAAAGRVKRRKIMVAGETWEAVAGALRDEPVAAVLPQIGAVNHVMTLVIEEKEITAGEEDGDHGQLSLDADSSGNGVKDEA